MTHPREPLQRRHWNFARHLIGLREGETPVRGARSSLGTKWIHQSTRTLSGARLRKVLDRLSGDTYGVAFHEYKALHWRYDETSHVILWNRVVAEGDSASLLCERPWIAGAVFREEKEIERFAIRFLILTSPRGKNVDVLITRTSGVCLYEGSTVRGEEGLRASLREVGPERTPTLVEAFVSNGNIRVDFRLGLESIRPKRRPLRILSDTMEMNG